MRNIYRLLAKHHSPIGGFWLAKVRCYDILHKTIRLNELTASSRLKNLWKHLISFPPLFPCGCYGKKLFLRKSSFIIFPPFTSKGKQHSLPKKHTFSLHCLMCIADNNVLGPPCSACAAEAEQTSGIGTLGELQVAESMFACLEFLELGTTDSWNLLWVWQRNSEMCAGAVFPMHSY